MIILFLFLLLFPSLVNANQIDEKCPQFVVWGAPISSHKQIKHLCRSGYANEFNFNYRLSNYVLEKVTVSGVSGKVVRKNDFREDTDIPAEFRTKKYDYIRTGYDRGHLAPAADFTDDIKKMSESFLLSNIAPQYPSINRGVWKKIEEWTRTIAIKYNEVYVITGPIFNTKKYDQSPVLRIPDSFYKIVIEPKQEKIITFIVPNFYTEKNEITDFISTVSDVESKTDINFSPQIPKQLELLEKNKSSIDTW